MALSQAALQALPQGLWARLLRLPSARRCWQQQQRVLLGAALPRLMCCCRQAVLLLLLPAGQASCLKATSVCLLLVLLVLGQVLPNHLPHQLRVQQVLPTTVLQQSSHLAWPQNRRADLVLPQLLMLR